MTSGGSNFPYQVFAFFEMVPNAPVKMDIPVIFAITETWLNVNDDTIRCAACPEGYYLADHPRSTGRGGGTALLYRE